MNGATPMRITRFVGVYNAEGTLKGELAYWFGRRRGTAHCALCDITHGNVRERSDWKRCRSGLPVPFDTYHLDDQPDEIRLVVDGVTPVVVAYTDDGPVLLLGPDDLDACRASPDQLVQALRAALADRGMVWPEQRSGP